MGTPGALLGWSFFDGRRGHGGSRIRFVLLWDNSRRECFARAHVPHRPAGPARCRRPAAGRAAAWRRRRRLGGARRCGPSSTRSSSGAPMPPWNTARSFDGVRPDTVRVPASRLAEALAELDPDVRAALEVAIERTRAVHADQRRTDTTTTLAPGATVTERWVPVERVGLYVPGGNAVYPSSVVMNVVPAQTAGVDSLVIASPPQAAVRRAAAPDHPGRRRAARRRRGLGGRRCAGRGAAGLRRHRHRRRGTGAGRHDHRAGQHLRHRRQADLPLAGRHRRRGRPDRDRDPRRPLRRSGARRRRSDQPGRARRDGRQRAGHHQRASWPTPPTPSSPLSWRPPCTASG